MAIQTGFEVLARDGAARRTRFETAHGAVQAPTFMPVGTQGTVKAVLPRDVEETGAHVVLANTYHLSLGDRTELVERVGGLHRFMCWPRTILTDSGGFQVFSLPGKEVTDDGVSFPSESSGQRWFLDAEASMDIQRRLGADIVMAFDECCDHDAPRRYVERSLDRTSAWAQRSRRCDLADHQLLFGIVQGGIHDDLRERSAEQICGMDFEGFAIGGVSVGEGPELMKAVVEHTAPLLPDNRPRYLMGVGTPEDILVAVAAGMDMFDCVIPTRYARGGTLFTRQGKLRIGDRRHSRDDAAVDNKCRCYTCKNYARMTLRHLLYAREPVFETLASIHNLQFYQDFMADIRHAISEHRFTAFAAEWHERTGKDKASEARPERRSRRSRARQDLTPGQQPRQKKGARRQQRRDD